MSKEADIAILQTLTDIKILLGRIESTLVSTNAYTKGLTALQTAHANDAERDLAASLMLHMAD